MFLLTTKLNNALIANTVFTENTAFVLTGSKTDYTGNVLSSNQHSVRDKNDILYHMSFAYEIKR